MAKRIVVTGGNAGIGLALCTQLVLEKGCFVYLGSRSLDKGEAAVQSILALAGENAKAASQNIELVQMDTTSDASIQAAAEVVKRGGPLYAIVNNAGAGLAHGVEESVVVDTNFYGPKRVCDAFIPLLEQKGRIVNVGSGAGPMYLRNQDLETKKFFVNPDVKWEELETFVQTASKNAAEQGQRIAYGLSKAALASYTMILAKEFPQFMVSCLSPGFINTAIVKGFGATKSAEEGTVSLHHCLFANLPGSGMFWGSDAQRSPLTTLRQPPAPPYNGEPEV